VLAIQEPTVIEEAASIWSSRYVEAYVTKGGFEQSAGVRIRGTRLEWTDGVSTPTNRITVRVRGGHSALSADEARQLFREALRLLDAVEAKHYAPMPDFAKEEE
jgi:hypothetical protein